MTWYLLCLLLCLTCKLLAHKNFIERHRKGDIFQASCNTCHLFAATCATGFTWFSCCSKCKCENGATIYQDMCYGNLAHAKFECQFFINDNQWYGLSTFTLQNYGPTFIGYIVRNRDWNKKHYTKCTVHPTSTYWDTKHWHLLFTGGRDVNDFRTDGSFDGVILKFVAGGIKKSFYDGLLIKFVLSCFSEGIVETSCLIVKLSGKRFYSEEPATTAVIPTTPSMHTTLHLQNTTAKMMHTNSTVNFSTTNKPINTNKPDAGLGALYILIIVFILVALIAFCGIFICCYRKKRNSSAPIEKQYLVSCQQSYQSSDSGSLVTSSEFEEINEPCYSDLNELKLFDINKRKAKKPSRKALYRAAQEQSQSGSVPVYVSTKYPSESGDSYFATMNT